MTTNTKPAFNPEKKDYYRRQLAIMGVEEKDLDMALNTMEIKNTPNYVDVAKAYKSLPTFDSEQIAQNIFTDDYLADQVHGKTSKGAMYKQSLQSGQAGHAVRLIFNMFKSEGFSFTVKEMHDLVLKAFEAKKASLKKDGHDIEAMKLNKQIPAFGTLNGRMSEMCSAGILGHVKNASGHDRRYMLLIDWKDKDQFDATEAWKKHLSDSKAEKKASQTIEQMMVFLMSDSIAPENEKQVDYLLSKFILIFKMIRDTRNFEYFDEIENLRQEAYKLVMDGKSAEEEIKKIRKKLKDQNLKDSKNFRNDLGISPIVNDGEDEDDDLIEDEPEVDDEPDINEDPEDL